MVAHRIPPHVVAVLQRATVTGAILRIDEQLDRKLYLETNKVLEILGGRWDRRASGHVFTEDPRLVLEEALLSGAVVDLDRENQFFETPREVAERLVAAADVRDGDLVLEPSAGKGAILHALPRRLLVTTVEIDPRHDADLLRVCERFGSASVNCVDFLDDEPMVPWSHPGGYHAIVMNPPFSGGRWARHVLHAFPLLRPGGRLAAVVPASVDYAMDANARQVRALAVARGAIERLPDGSFSEVGTMVSTRLLTLTAEL